MVRTEMMKKEKKKGYGQKGKDQTKIRYSVRVSTSIIRQQTLPLNIHRRLYMKFYRFDIEKEENSSSLISIIICFPWLLPKDKRVDILNVQTQYCLCFDKACSLFTNKL